MDKKITDYLHLYLGCAIIDATDNNLMVCPSLDADFLNYLLNSKRIKNFRMVLRKLSDMTEEEKIECGYVRASQLPTLKSVFYADQVVYLLSKHFDLFGLIESGLANDKTKQ